MVTRLFACLALFGAACSGASTAEERYERGLKPVDVVLESGVSLRAAPAGHRLDSTGRHVVHAAAPSLTLTLTATVASSASFVLENVSPYATLAPAADTQISLDATTLELTYRLQPGTTEVKLEPGGTGVVRLAIVSDLHQNMVLIESLRRQVRERGLEAILTMGDLGNDRADVLDQMLAELHASGVPFYMTLGNHELGAASERFLETMGPSNTSFALRGARIVLVDSASGAIAPSSYPWLASEIGGRPETVALVLTHIPPIDPVGARENSFCVRDDAEHFLQVLSDGAASHLFVGHQHTWLEYSLRGIPVTLTGAGGDGVESLTDQKSRFAEVTVDPVAITPIVVTPRDLD